MINILNLEKALKAEKARDEAFAELSEIEKKVYEVATNKEVENQENAGSWGHSLHESDNARDATAELNRHVRKKASKELKPFLDGEAGSPSELRQDQELPLKKQHLDEMRKHLSDPELQKKHLAKYTRIKRPMDYDDEDLIAKAHMINNFGAKLHSSWKPHLRKAVKQQLASANEYDSPRARKNALNKFAATNKL